MSALTRIEAGRLLDDYRMSDWAGATMDRAALIDILTGHGWDDLPTRVDGITSAWAKAALSWWSKRHRVPPSPRDLHDALDQVTSSPDTIRSRIDEARAAINAAKARRAQDHEQLRRAAAQRKQAS